MKVGQVLSTVDFTAIPESRARGVQGDARRAARRRRRRCRSRRSASCSRRSSAARSATHFADFEEEAFAAASIGQVHRAVTLDGDEVAVKVQYPGVAEAVESDLRNLSLLLPLVKRLAPGLDVKALYGELRERIAEELDYEIEAQNHRAVARAYRGHPFVLVPQVHTELSSRRVLVTELLARPALRARSRRSTRPSATASARSSSASSSRRCSGPRRVCGDPHPGNYLLLDDGRVGFLDFGLMRIARRATTSRASARSRGPSWPRTRSEVHAILAAPRLPAGPGRLRRPRRCSSQLLAAGEWYLQPGFRRLTPQYVTELIDATASPRSPWFEQLRRRRSRPRRCSSGAWRA